MNNSMHKNDAEKPSAFAQQIHVAVHEKLDTVEADEYSATSKKAAQRHYLTIVHEVFLACEKVACTYAERYYGDKANNYPDPNMPLFHSSSSNLGLNEVYNLQYFDQLSERVNLQKLLLPGELGKKCFELTSSLRRVREGYDRKIFSVISLLVIGLLGFAACAPSWGIHWVPQWLTQWIGQSTALPIIGRVLCFIMAFCAMGCAIDDEFANDGILGQIVSWQAWGYIGLIVFGGYAWGLTFGKEIPWVIATLACICFIPLGILFGIADFIKAREYPYVQRAAQMRFCELWENECESLLTKYIALHTHWWSAWHPTEELPEGILKLQQFYDELKKNYDSFKVSE